MTCILHQTAAVICHYLHQKRKSSKLLKNSKAVMKLINAKLKMITLTAATSMMMMMMMIIATVVLTVVPALKNKYLHSTTQYKSYNGKSKSCMIFNGAILNVLLRMTYLLRVTPLCNVEFHACVFSIHSTMIDFIVTTKLLANSALIDNVLFCCNCEGKLQMVKILIFSNTALNKIMSNEGSNDRKHTTQSKRKNSTNNYLQECV